MDVVLVMLGVFVIAFAFAPLGLGGGMLFVPLLHYALKQPIDGTTLAISLALTWAVSIGSGARHRREGFYDKDATMSTLYGAVVGALIGVGVVNALGNDLDASFKLISVFVLVWALVKTWRKQRDTGLQTITHESRNGSMNHFKLRLGGGFGGMLSSLLGVGAGVIYVPTLQHQAGLGARASIGSSLTIMTAVVPVAIFALLTTAQGGLVQQLGGLAWWFYLLPALAFFGATVGATFGITKVSQERIMLLFMFMIAVVLIRYLVDVVDIMT